jgi:hypothetical protein
MKILNLKDPSSRDRAGERVFWGKREAWCPVYVPVMSIPRIMLPAIGFGILCFHSFLSLSAS